MTNVVDLHQRGEDAPRPHGWAITMTGDGHVTFRDQEALNGYVASAQAEALREAAEELLGVDSRAADWLLQRAEAVELG